MLPSPHRSWFVVFSLFVSMLGYVGLTQPAIALPVIPNAVGYGIETPAGRGGTVIRVTNLQDSGTGSLRAALTASGPRTVIFETSGLITLNSPIKINNSNITVAGQTAPSPGITVRGKITINASDVLIQHIAIRPGAGCVLEGPSWCGDWDALQVDGAIDSNVGKHNARIVLDHVSLSWAADEVIAFGVGPDSGSVRDITLRNSIVSEGLYYPNHPSGRPYEGYGVLVFKNAERVALLQNLMALNFARNPLIRDDTSDVAVINNLIYRPATTYDNGAQHVIYFGSRGDRDVPLRARVEGNVALLAPGANSKIISILDRVPTITQIFLKNNRSFVPNSSGTSGTWYPSTNNPPNAWDPSLIHYWNSNRTEASVRVDVDPTPPIAGLVPMTTDIQARVLERVGARPADREPVDQRIIGHVTQGTGGIIGDPVQVGGYPALAQNYRALVEPAAGDADGDGYTNIEEWLHGMAAEVEGYVLDPVSAILDDFQDNDISDWQSQDAAASWSITNTGASLALLQSDVTADARTVKSGTLWTDQTIQADVKPRTFGSSGSWYGLVARYNDSNNYYYLVVTSGGLVELKKIVNGNYSALDAVNLPAQSIALNKPNRLRLEAVGTSLRVYFDNRLLLQATDNTFASGRAGIMMWRTAAEYDNVRITPNAQVTLLAEDFEDGIADAWTADGTSAWSVQIDGTTRVYRQSNMTGTARAYAGNGNWTNQVIDADVKPLALAATGWFGLMIRYQDPNNFYYLLVGHNGTSSNKLELKRIINGTYIALDDYSHPVAAGTNYKLRFEAVGNALKAYINGNLVMEANDPTFPSGKVGLTMWKAETQFDNIVVAQP